MWRYLLSALNCLFSSQGHGQTRQHFGLRILLHGIAIKYNVLTKLVCKWLALEYSSYSVPKLPVNIEQKYNENNMSWTSLGKNG